MIRFVTSFRWQLLLAAVLVQACALDAAPPQDEASEQGALRPVKEYQVSQYAFGEPDWMPAPMEPVSNPTTAEKVALGRRLFYDVRLSLDETKSCASCHRQELAFTDGQQVSVGVTKELTLRNSMSLANAAYSPVLTWANPLMHSLETQALVPLVGTEPVELGLGGLEGEMTRRLRGDSVYPALFLAAFPETDGDISLATVTRALAAFQRTLISARSPYDKYRYEGDIYAISDAAIRGEALFFSEKFECHHCHNGINFNDTVFHARDANGQRAFHNTGLYNLDGNGAYPARDTGLLDITGRPADMGRFKTPTLRNVAVTAPYMHDGSIATLDEVIDHYAAGGRAIETGPNAGVGSENPFKSSFVPGFEVSPDERADLITFLQSLTDEQFLTDPRYSNPFLSAEERK